MFAEISLQPSQALKNRRGWLVGFGLVHILIACCCLLLVVVTIVQFISGLSNMSTSSPSPSPTRFVEALFCGILVPIFLVLGVGSLKCKDWARIASQIVSGCWLLGARRR